LLQVGNQLLLTASSAFLLVLQLADRSCDGVHTGVDGGQLFLQICDPFVRGIDGSQGLFHLSAKGSQAGFHALQIFANLLHFGAGQGASGGVASGRAASVSAANAAAQVVEVNNLGGNALFQGSDQVALFAEFLLNLRKGGSVGIDCCF